MRIERRKRSGVQRNGSVGAITFGFALRYEFQSFHFVVFLVHDFLFFFLGYFTFRAFIFCFIPPLKGDKIIETARTSKPA